MVESILKKIVLLLSRVIYNLKEDTWRRRFMDKWNYLVWKEEYILERDIKTHYSNIKTVPVLNHRVVFMSDGLWVSGGLCDKFRGIVSLYLLCERLKCEFKIRWVYPFNIEDYLIPNEIDWLYESECIKDKGCEAIQMMSYGDYFDIVEKDKQYKRLKSLLEKKTDLREIHVYTNAHFGNNDFNRIFSLLFKPSKRISKLLNQYLPSCHYISMSFRFLQLLGDFQDRSGGEVLSDEMKDIYIENTLRFLSKYHEENTTRMIFVASDSSIILDRVKGLPYVFTTPGLPKHSDLPAHNFDKEFLDFFTISKADEIYLCKTGKMYTSGFPYYASLAGGKTFGIIDY